MKLLIVAVVLLAECGLLCWYGGYLFGRQSATSAAFAAQAARTIEYQSYRERERAEAEVRRLHIVQVEFVRFVDARLSDDPWAQVEFKLTNRSGKAINELTGSIRFYDSRHQFLGMVGENVIEPLSIDGSARGRTRWTLLDEATRSALVSGNAIADFHADQVFYDDGAIQRFGEPIPDADFIDALTATAK